VVLGRTFVFGLLTKTYKNPKTLKNFFKRFFQPSLQPKSDRVMEIAEMRGEKIGGGAGYRIILAKYSVECLNSELGLQSKSVSVSGGTGSSCLPAAHAFWLNTRSCAWLGSEISVICCELSSRPPVSPGHPNPNPNLDLLNLDLRH